MTMETLLLPMDLPEAKKADSADCPRTPCSESFDTEHRDYITCPKCGDHDPESEKFTNLAETKETGKCSTCGQVFTVIRHVTITYSTICIPNAEAIHGVKGATK